ncbi:MAG: alpha/beta fold hydrolase, partial [Pseudomonadota bacterium]
GPVYTITLEPPSAEIGSLAVQLHARIETICAETNQPQLIIIAHSMGGLVTRAYMAEQGAQRIATFVTLGTPHRGTRTALMGVGACVRQMRWEGEWITALATRERAAKMPPTLSLYTTNDDLVYPPESSSLDWAENMAVSGVGHVGLLFSANVAARVAKFIRQCQQGVPSTNT